MAWTYSGDPASSTLDAIRFEIGDTDTTDQLVNNEEINYAYSVEGTVRKAGARCLESLSNKYSRLADRELGPIKEDLSKLSEAFAKRASELRFLGKEGSSVPSGGFLSPNVKAPIFQKGMHDNEE